MSTPPVAYTVSEANSQGEPIGPVRWFQEYHQALAYANTLTFWRLYRSTDKFPIADCLSDIT